MRLWFVVITLLIFQLAGAPTFAREPQRTKLTEVTLADLPKKDELLSLRSSKAGHFRTKEMAWSSAISSGGYLRRSAATIVNTPSPRQARATAVRAES